jgi:hypothetical protein
LNLKAADPKIEFCRYNHFTQLTAHGNELAPPIRRGRIEFSASFCCERSHHRP